MKYLVILCDGMSDLPLEALSGKTPMQAAKKPYMDLLASRSEVGLVKTVPDGLKPGSDIANLSVMGYDPDVYYSGRSPLEAVSIGIDLSDTDVTLRCNLVTLSGEPQYEDKTLVDYCAGDISTKEAKELIEHVQKHMGSGEFTFYPGVSYRHCLVWKNGAENPGKLTPPHDITGRQIEEYIPCGSNTAKLYDMMKKSYEILMEHPVNLKRIAEGKSPANSIWLWGEGKKPRLDSFKSKFGLNGSVISAVDLIKGIGICAGMRSVDVPGATGYIDTDFEGKLKAALGEFQNGQDFVYIHIEAPDECGHRGEIENKVRSIELIDKLVIKRAYEEMKRFVDYSILICPDHPTPLSIRTHTSDAVPYLIYRSDDKKCVNEMCFCEKSAEEAGIFIEKGHELIKRLIF